MLNNKGQSLVLFIVVLPILLLMLILVLDIGRMIYLNQELNGISKIVLDYGLDNLENDNLIDELDNLVRLNKDDIDKVDIELDGEKIYLNLYSYYSGTFLGFVDKSNLNVNVSYVGYLNNGEKRIEKLGD